MVLLVDDQAIVAQGVRRMLIDLPDIDLYYCADPIDAIKKTNRISPTVILQDLVMPSVDGLDLVQLFRADPGTADAPIIVLSSEEDSEVKSRAYAWSTEGLATNELCSRRPNQRPPRSCNPAFSGLHFEPSSRLLLSPVGGCLF
jgi:CheY-like chemotaxis protein